MSKYIEAAVKLPEIIKLVESFPVSYPADTDFVTPAMTLRAVAELLSEAGKVYVLHQRDEDNHRYYVGVFGSVEAIERHITKHHGGDYRRGDHKETSLTWTNYHHETYEAELAVVQ